MAVLSIILTAPTGAILINTLGTRWLSDDTEWMDQKTDDVVEDSERKLGQVAAELENEKREGGHLKLVE